MGAETKNRTKIKRGSPIVAVGILPWWKRLFMRSESASMNDNNNNSDETSKSIDKLYDELDDLESMEIKYNDDPKLLQNRPWQERAIVLSGGVIFNLLLAFSIYFGTIGPLGGVVKANAG